MESQERIVFSMEHTNGPLDRERLMLPERRDREKALSTWEEMGSTAQVEGLVFGHRRPLYPLKREE